MDETTMYVMARGMIETNRTRGKANLLTEQQLWRMARAATHEQVKRVMVNIAEADGYQLGHTINGQIVLMRDE